MFVIKIAGGLDPVVGPFKTEKSAEHYLEDRGWRTNEWLRGRERGIFTKESTDDAKAYVASIVQLVHPTTPLDFHK